MADLAVGNALKNLKISATVGSVHPGANILISLSSSGSSDGNEGHVLISSGPVAPPPSPCLQGTYVAFGPAQTVNGLQVQLLSINFLPSPGWAEIKLNGTGYDVGVGKTVITQLGDLTLYALKDMGACFALPGISVPPPPPPPPPPLLSDCKFPELSWNLIEVLSQLVKWIGCLLNQVISLMGSVIASLAGIADYLLHLPDHLDEWVSRLFGIDPALPFFPELMRKIDLYVSARFGVDPEKPIIDELAKKVMSWLLSLLDTAAENEKRGR